MSSEDIVRQVYILNEEDEKRQQEAALVSTESRTMRIAEGVRGENQVMSSRVHEVGEPGPTIYSERANGETEDVEVQHVESAASGSESSDSDFWNEDD